MKGQRYCLCKFYDEEILDLKKEKYITKMKIGLVTLFGYSNYGNKLQNYAVQTLLEKRGHTVETIIYYPNFYKQIFINICKIFAGFLHVASYRRFYNFYRFSRKFIHVRYVRDMEELSRLSASYDLFVVGSDQVWNPYLRKKQRDFYFLQFVENEKRACIAPSFGIEEIPDEFQEMLKNYINTFPVLSSREKEGVSIIKKLVNRDAWHLIDPTMALSKKEWMTIAKVVELPGRPYILKAFLGKTTVKRDKDISELAMKKNMAWKIWVLFSSNCHYTFKAWVLAAAGWEWLPLRLKRIISLF